MNVKRTVARALCLAVCTAAAASLEAASDSEDPETAEPVTLCVGNYQSEKQAAAQLERFAATYSTLDEWQARAAIIRRQMLRGANLDPLPRRTALEPIRHSKRELEGYSVENVAFESVPGLFVCGNLYRPLGGKAPHAGVGWSLKGGLNPHIGYNVSHFLFKGLSWTFGGVDYLICRSIWPNYPKGISPWRKKDQKWGSLYFPNTRELWKTKK